jgi:hypothetical protein
MNLFTVALRGSALRAEHLRVTENKICHPVLAGLAFGFGFGAGFG